MYRAGAAVVSTITCLYSLCRMNRLQLSIGKWLRDHKETILVFFRSWSRYVSFMYFHVFFDKLSNKLMGFFCLSVTLFSDEIAFSSIVRIKTISLGAILSFAKKSLG